MSSPALKSLVICVILAAVIAVVFAATVSNGFTGYDDGEYVVDNTHVSTGISRANLIWAFTAWHSNNWHPFTWISHALDCSLFGMAPKGHHLTSLILHIANTLLLFLWLTSVTGRLGCSAFVALGFGLHPLHVESVAWVAERKDVLSTFFWLLTLRAYTAWVRRPGWARYVLVASWFTAGLLSKQMLVTVPVLLLLIDWWPLRRTEGLRRLVVEKVPLLFLSVLSSAIVIWVQRQGGAAASLDQLPLAPRLSNAAHSYSAYIYKVLWPTNLSVFYPFPAGGVGPLLVASSAALILGVTVIVFVFRRERPWLAAGWAWYVITLLPVIGIVQVGMQSMADRYMYVPLIGLLIAVAWEAAELGRRSVPAGRLAAVSGAIVLAGWAILSWQQIAVWQDGVTLFTHALKVNPDNFLAHDNLGVELDRRGRFDEALFHYRETLRLKPGDRNGETNLAAASFAKGERLIAAGKQDEALIVLRDGLRYRPQSAIAHVQIGRILSRQQKLPAAIVEFQQALQIDPAQAAAHMGLGVAYAWSRRPAEARSAFEKTLHYDSQNVEAHYDLGMVLSVLQQPTEARRHFEAAVGLNPKFGAAHVALAEMNYASGRFQDAWREINAARAAHADVDPELIALVSARLQQGR